MFDELRRHVREAALVDLGEILEVQRRAGRATSDAFIESIARGIDDPFRIVVVAERDQLVVGWAATAYFGDVDDAAPAGHYLMGLTVVPEERLHGFGRALITARMIWIRRHAPDAYYFANETNEASMTAHRDWPFEEIGRASTIRGVQFAGNTEGVLYRASFA